MSLTSWVDDRIKGAVQAAVPALAAALGAKGGQLAQSIAEGVIEGLADVLEAKIGAIPAETSGLLHNELTQLPGQVKDVLDIPAEVGQALEGLPQQIEQAVLAAIKGLVPFPFARIAGPGGSTGR